MKIKIYKASGFYFTPFGGFVDGDLEYLKENGVEFVDNVKNADVIISQNFKHLKKHLWRGLVFGKKFLIWTNEPRFNTSFKHEIKAFFSLVKCHIMNVYTKNIFISNITIHCGLINEKLNLIDEDYELKSRKIAALMSFYKGLQSEPLIRDNENIDLIALRSEIALKGNELDCLDVYGKGWPAGVSKEDSREGDWVNRKKELLKDYNFNLAFENTASFNYMTEKIWGGIENYCLPIYYGKHTNAYEIFPKNSFIDYSEFNSPEKLFEYINNMSSKEFVSRMNSCIKTYNQISEKGPKYADEERKKMLKAIMVKLKYITNNNPV